MQGCSQTFDNPKPYVHSKEKICNKDVTVIIKPGMRHDGLAIWNDTHGLILLRRYPVCLEHEKKHICEGYWHGQDRRNGEYCEKTDV